MTRQDDGFPIDARNRAKRMHERAAYDQKAVFEILDSGLVAHIAYSIAGQPFCTPTLFWREGTDLFWHGSAASRMLEHQHGVQVCLTVSHIDGLVLARSAFHHSVNYRSVMCFGKAQKIEDERKPAALRALIERFYPQRWQYLRPILAKESKASTLIVMKIEQASAKVRAYGVRDDDEDLEQNVWAGVIPITTQIGAAEPCNQSASVQGQEAFQHWYRQGQSLDQALLAAQMAYSKSLYD